MLPTSLVLLFQKDHNYMPQNELGFRDANGIADSFAPLSPDNRPNYRPACFVTGRRRDGIRLLFTSASLVAYLLLAMLAGFCRTELQQILVHGFGGILMLALGYVTLSQLYRFATAKCLACGGHGSPLPPRRATPYLWPDDRKRLGMNRCLHCGYDLTGNESGVCPECGTEINPALSDSQSELQQP